MDLHSTTPSHAAHPSSSLLETKHTSNNNIEPMDSRSDLSVKVLNAGEPFPAEYIALREDVYVTETQLADEPFYINDHCCSHLLGYKDGKLVASVTFGAAEDTDFSKWSNIPVEDLKNTVFMTRGVVAPEYRGSGYYKYLIYNALSLYRRQGRTRVVTYSEQGSTAAKKVISPDVILNSKLRDAGGYQVECIEADISYVMWKMFEGFPQNLKNLAVKTIIRDEIEFYAKHKVKQFYNSPFYNAVLNKTLTKKQYLEIQANTYCYVQWTTRVIARLLTLTADVDMFKELSHHLVEEDGHPQMIIDDMKVCGATDEYIEYVTKGMVPNYRIDAFMSTQEAATGFRTDPVGFMGVPIAIEGISAFMPPIFATRLKELAASWGIEEPNKAITFWASHVIFDNPVNGHWARMIDLVRTRITNERQVRQILNYIDNVIENVTAGYSAPMSEIHT